MKQKEKLTSVQVSKIKKILWKFFCSSFKKGYLDNPGTL
jgi:hypothetical protein